jgi:hypothetical protein
MPPRAKQQEPEPQLATDAAPESGSSADGMPSGNDVAEAVHTGQVLAHRNDAAVQAFMTWVTERSNSTDEDQYAIMASVMGEIMTAPNLAELMEERAPLHARNLIGQPLILFGFEIREGDYEESAIGFYAALTVGRPNSDQTRIVTCGGMKVLVKLMMIENFIAREDTDDSWPIPIVFTEKKTKRGYGVLDIIDPRTMKD